MQRNGLEHEEDITDEGIQKGCGGVLRSDCPEHCHSSAFLRILLVANALGDIRAAFGTACALIDRSQGEVVLLEVGQQASAPPFLAGSAAGANEASEIDVLEIHRPSINTAFINQIAQEYRCDLAILMMQPQSQAERLMSGCVAEEAFRRLKCPTLVFGPNSAGLSFAGPSGPVLFVTSFRHRNITAIGLASKLASLFDSPLECVHVLPADLAESVQGCHIVPQIMRNALVVNARQNQVPLTSEQCHIVYGHSVSGAVARFAELRRARFITMGIQEGGPAASHLPAGMTSSIIASAPCPVLLLASDE
jgi:nucleotide-binding universal stress UspA family protein